VDWMCAFTVVQNTLIAVDNIAWRTFIVFAVFVRAWCRLCIVSFPIRISCDWGILTTCLWREVLRGGVFGADGERTVEPAWHRDLLVELMRVRRRGLVSIGKASRTFLL
jgi:hypothetical protein